MRSMDNLIVIIQSFISILLVVLVLLQVRGVGGGGLFGGGDGGFRTRRGMEQILFRFTIVLAVVYVAISIVSATNRI